MMNKNYLFTSEAVSCGHPDKLADQISDAILDAFLEADPESRVAAEVLVTTDTVILAGERRSHAPDPDYDRLVRATIARAGYSGGFNEGFDAATVRIRNHIHAQSEEIASAVDAGNGVSEGAGDQGLMFGYACRETPTLMPAPIFYAHAVLQNLTTRRLLETTSSAPSRLRPDAKSQVTLEYHDGRPVRAHTLLVSHQHAPELSHDELEHIVRQSWAEVLPEGWLDANTRVLVNPKGSFVLGGPAGDTGLTGRKIIVDTYGGAARHGGGAFSGKDPTKVDRSAAYAARYLAKNIVAAGLADRCEIQLCYALGVAEPLAVYVETFDTLHIPHAKLMDAIHQYIQLTPGGIRKHLGLNAPIYWPTASGGHFGRVPNSAGPGTFSWEKTDLADALRQQFLK